MCEVISADVVPEMPGALAVTDANGASSIWRNCCIDFCTVATSSSGRRSLLPWPGKCMAAVCTAPLLPLCTPRMNACPIWPTQNGSPPKVRVSRSPLLPGRGVSSTSSGGPSSRLTPTACNSLPIAWPSESANVGVQVAPIAMALAKGLKPFAPPASAPSSPLHSRPISSGMRVPVTAEVAVRAAVGRASGAAAGAVAPVGVSAAVRVMGWVVPVPVSPCVEVMPVPGFSVAVTTPLALIVVVMRRGWLIASACNALLRRAICCGVSSITGTVPVAVCVTVIGNASLGPLRKLSLSDRNTTPPTR